MIHALCLEQLSGKEFSLKNTSSHKSMIKSHKDNTYEGENTKC